MIEHKEFLIDEIFGERLLISIRADQTELDDNIRVARVYLPPLPICLLLLTSIF